MDSSFYKIILVTLTALLISCGGGGSSSDDSDNSFTTNITTNTRTSIMASSRIQARQAAKAQISTDCNKKLCISDNEPTDGELPTNLIPAIEHENPNWKDLGHKIITPRFHIIWGGFEEDEHIVQGEISQCDGYPLPYDKCRNFVIEVYLYDTINKSSISIGGVFPIVVEGAGGTPLAQENTDLDNFLDRWFWFAPNSRYNKTDKLFLSAELNAGEFFDSNINDQDHNCGAIHGPSFVFWELDPSEGGFKPVHIGQCYPNEFPLGPTATDLSFAIDEEGLIYIPFSNNEDGSIQYRIFESSDRRPVLLDIVNDMTLKEVVDCPHIRIVDQNENGYIFRCQSNDGKVAHIHKPGAGIPAVILNSSNVYNMRYSFPVATGKEDGYMMGEYRIFPESGLSEKTCTIFYPGLNVRYGEKYCVSWDDLSGDLFISDKSNDQTVFHEIVPHLADLNGICTTGDSSEQRRLFRFNRNEETLYITNRITCGFAGTYWTTEYHKQFVSIDLFTGVQYVMDNELTDLEVY